MNLLKFYFKTSSIITHKKEIESLSCNMNQAFGFLQWHKSLFFLCAVLPVLYKMTQSVFHHFWHYSHTFRSKYCQSIPTGQVSVPPACLSVQVRALLKKTGVVPLIEPRLPSGRKKNQLNPVLCCIKTCRLLCVCSMELRCLSTKLSIIKPHLGSDVEKFKLWTKLPRTVSWVTPEK